MRSSGGWYLGQPEAPHAHRRRYGAAARPKQTAAPPQKGNSAGLQTFEKMYLNARAAKSSSWGAIPLSKSSISKLLEHFLDRPTYSH
jgi:hypothetical protein